MIIGLDIGGHKVAGGLVQDGRILKEHTVATPDSREMDDLVDTVSKLVNLFALDGTGPVRGIGVGVPGFVSFDRRVVKLLPNFKGYRDVPLAEMLEKSLGMPVKLENDAICSTIGEMRYGVVAGASDFAMFTLGTGVGGGLVSGGKVVVGAHGMAGEVGHIVAFGDAPCGCGGLGHVESYFSADRLEEQARRVDPELSVLDFWNLRFDNAVARGVWDLALRALSQGLVSIVHAMDPEVIVISGGLSNLPDIIGELRERMKPLLSLSFGDGPSIIKSSLGNKGAIIGAASLFD